MAVHMRLFKTPQACGCTFVDIGRCGSTALSVSSPPNAGGKSIVCACRNEGGSFCRSVALRRQAWRVAFE